MTRMPPVDAPHLIKAALSFLWREVGASQLHRLIPSTVLDGATLGGAAGWAGGASTKGFRRLSILVERSMNWFVTAAWIVSYSVCNSLTPSTGEDSWCSWSCRHEEPRLYWKGSQELVEWIDVYLNIRGYSQVGSQPRQLSPFRGKAQIQNPKRVKNRASKHKVTITGENWTHKGDNDNLADGEW